MDAPPPTKPNALANLRAPFRKLIETAVFALNSLNSRLAKHFPEFVEKVDSGLEAIFGVMSHPAFAIILTLIIVVIAPVVLKAIPAVVFATCFVFWLWVIRAKPIRALRAMPRLGAIVAIALILAFADVRIQRWALNAYNQQKTADSPLVAPQIKVEDKRSPDEIKTADGPPIPTEPPTATNPTKNKSELSSRVNESKRETRSKPVKESEPPAFAVAVEVKLLVPGPSSNEAGTGFWGVSALGANCFLRSADVVMLIRIKNLQSLKTMIAAYNVYVYGRELSRIKMTTNKPMEILTRGVIPPNFNGKLSIPIPAPSGNVGGGFIQVKYAETDFSVAAPVVGDILDTEIADHYLGQGDTVRGWAFFEYPPGVFVPIKLTLKITDDLGHTFSYEIPDEAGNPSGDALRREIVMTGPPVNLSSCIRVSHPAQRPEGAKQLPEQPTAKPQIKDVQKNQPSLPTPQSGQGSVQTGSINTGPCSNVQIGGQGNQATTNCETSRSLTPEEKTQFIKSLRQGPPGTVTVWAVESSQNLGMEIYDALKVAGWQMQEPEVQMMLLAEPMHEDIDVFVHGDPGETGTFSTSDPPTVTLMHSLSSLGRFKSGGMGRSDRVAKGTVKVVVGPPAPN